MKLSEHFSLEELIASAKAKTLRLDNTPSAEHLENLRNTANCMEAVRTLLGGKAITILSGYRGLKLNAAVGGVGKSAHTFGNAVDFICPSFGSSRDIALAVLKSGIKYDQLILEPTWVHIAFDKTLRMEKLTATRLKGGMVYSAGIK